MKIFKMNPENPDKELINKAIDIMACGGVILYPTDTVYGLGANIFNNDAVKRIYEIKKRDYSKPLSILVSNMECLPLIAQINNDNLKIMNNWLPGPFTFILNKKSIVSPFVSANAKVGVRIPDYEIATSLASIFPITTTSANISDEDTLSNPEDIIKQIGDSIDLVIDVGPLESSKPSTVIDLSLPNPYLIRRGQIGTKIKDFQEDIENIDIINNIENIIGETLENMIITDIIKENLDNISIKGNLENINMDDFKENFDNIKINQLIKENLDNIRIDQFIKEYLDNIKINQLIKENIENIDIKGNLESKNINEFIKENININEIYKDLKSKKE